MNYSSLTLPPKSWDYSLVEGVVRHMAAAAIACHLLFYFCLHHEQSDIQSLLVRMGIVALYTPFLLYPKKSWRPFHKVYFELALAVTMPGYFSYMLLLDTSIYWAAALVTLTMFYGVFARWQAAVVLFPLALMLAFLAASPPSHVAGEVVRVELIGLLALVLVQVLKFFFEASHRTMTELKEKADKQNDIFSALLDISVEVSRFDDLDDIFHLLLMRFEKIFPGRGFGLLVEGPRPKILPNMAFRGISQKDSTFLLQVHPYVLGFASVGTGGDEEQLSSLEGEEWQVFGGGIRSQSIKGETYYCFKLFVKGRRLDGEERQTLEVFLETIRGMTRSRIQAMELERYSNTDHLTGLFNRNYFDSLIDEWKRKAVDEKPFSVIFGDINGLKRINDTYGHQAGDLLISSCAELLVKQARSSDLVFRLGGDEVVILCPATDKDQAGELLKRINTSLATLYVPCVNEVNGEVTNEKAYISFGIAASNEPDTEDVVTLADKRMFENKNRWYETGEMERYR